MWQVKSFQAKHVWSDDGPNDAEWWLLHKKRNIMSLFPSRVRPTWTSTTSNHVKCVKVNSRVLVLNFISNNKVFY